MRTRLGLLLLLLLLGLLLPSSASAAYVRYQEGQGRTGIWFEDMLGEKNDVTITQSGRTITFHDDSAPIQSVWEQCERIDEHTARCTVPEGPVIDVFVLLDDGADRAVNVNATDPFISGRGGDDTLSTNVPARLDGGSGNDVLTGSEGDDTLIGAQGDDRLYGRGGNDDLAGDAGYFPMTRGHDVVDGGDGVDTVYYAHRLSAVRVDLRRSGGQGAKGENDVLTGLEGVETSGGADRIVAPVSGAKCGAKSDEVVLPDAQTLIAGDCDRTRVIPSLVALTGRWTVKANGAFSLPLFSRKRCTAWVAAFKEGFGRVGRVKVEMRPARATAARMALAERGRVVITVRDCGPLLTFSLEL